MGDARGCIFRYCHICLFLPKCHWLAFTTFNAIVQDAEQTRQECYRMFKISTRIFWQVTVFTCHKLMHFHISQGRFASIRKSSAPYRGWCWDLGLAKSAELGWWPHLGMVHLWHIWLFFDVSRVITITVKMLGVSPNRKESPLNGLMRLDNLCSRRLFSQLTEFVHVVWFHFNCFVPEPWDSNLTRTCRIQKGRQSLQFLDVKGPCSAWDVCSTKFLHAMASP